jgi:hypothetical protein
MSMAPGPEAEAPGAHLGPETPPPAFADPAIDTVVAMLLELAQELWVTRARLAALEANAGPAPALTPEAEAELAAARADFVRRLFAPVERL